MSRRVHGSGPVPCEFCIVGEGPGWEEDRAGKPFVGKTRQELDRYLDGNNLPAQSDVFTTYIYREYKGKDYVYTSDDLLRDEQDLVRELRQVRPRIIIPLGRHATRYFLGDVDMDSTQRIPWRLPPSAKLDFLSDDTVVFPIVHPAAGFHNPEMSPHVVAGFQEFARFLEGEIDARGLFEDPYPSPVYTEITTVEQLHAVLSEARGANLAIDTEGSVRVPWSIQFSWEPGTAFVVRPANRDVLAGLARHFRTYRPRLTYHSALHDLSVLRALHLPTDLDFDDTMVQAYLLQLEPQGLKPLCVRHCGMQMQSYDEVLGDASQRLAIDYFLGLWDIEQLDYEARREEAFWQEIDLGRRIKVPPKLPKTPLHKAVERALRSANARNLWSNQVEDIQVAAYNRLGPIPEASLDHTEPAIAIHYGARDADGTTRVREQLRPRVAALGLDDVYHLELGTYPLIERMAYVGLRPDLDHFARLSTTLQGEIDVLKDSLQAVTGSATFNANSGDQVADYVFDTLGLEGVKKTSSGRFSTNDKILEALEHEHPEFPVLTDIRAYRELYKLKNTFVDRIPDFVHRWPHDGRVHSTFRTTRVVTGRLAASDPNLLAMPKHGKFAKDFRKGWIPGDGHILAEWDLSQIELRVLAHLSQDPVLLAVFRGAMRNPDGSKVDLHANLAQRIFGGAPADHLKGTSRLAAKAINFGLAMGMTYKGLSVELRKNGMNVSEDDAQRWIDETMTLYAGVPPYQDRMGAEAKRNGYIRCLSGRIRYIGGIASRDERVREEAKRFAFSTPIQEGAQWLMKQAEIRLWAELQRRWNIGQWIEPLIQVHDALTLETTPDLGSDVNQFMVWNMTQTPAGFSVPVETSGDYGRNWAEMKEF